MTRMHSEEVVLRHAPYACEFDVLKDHLLKAAYVD
jgi:hypothetical protein